jgi:hypothetical protein
MQVYERQLLKEFLFTTFDQYGNIIDQTVLHADIHKTPIQGDDILQLEEALGSVLMKLNFCLEDTTKLDEGNVCYLLTHRM